MHYRTKLAALTGSVAILATVLVANPAVAGGTDLPHPLPLPPKTSTMATAKPIPGQHPAGDRHGFPLLPGHATTLSNPATCSTPSPGCYLYDGARQIFSPGVDGGDASWTVSNNFIDSKTSHVLTEISAQSSDQQQTIEIGSYKAPGDTGSSLFVSCWINGVFQGYNGGCDYLNAAGRTQDPGSLLTAGTHRFAIEHFDASSGVTPGWWVWLDTAWVGRFADTAWTAAPSPAPAFAANGQVGVVQVFDEAASMTVQRPCGDLGTGQLPSGAAPQTATYNNVYPLSVAQSWTAFTSTDSVAYDATTPTTTSMKMGGPGYNSLGQTGVTGATGSCAPATAGTAPSATIVAWGEYCPDGQTSTGCNNVGSWTASLGLNVCTALTPNYQYDTKIFKNNGTGHTYQLWATSGCTGGTALSVANNTQGDPTFEPHAIKRTS